VPAGLTGARRNGGCGPCSACPLCRRLEIFGQAWVLTRQTILARRFDAADRPIMATSAISPPMMDHKDLVLPANGTHVRVKVADYVSYRLTGRRDICDATLPFMRRVCVGEARCRPLILAEVLWAARQAPGMIIQSARRGPA